MKKADLLQIIAQLQRRVELLEGTGNGMSESKTAYDPKAWVGKLWRITNFDGSTPKKHSDDFMFITGLAGSHGAVVENVSCTFYYGHANGGSVMLDDGCCSIDSFGQAGYRLSSWDEFDEAHDEWRCSCEDVIAEWRHKYSCFADNNR